MKQFLKKLEKLASLRRQEKEGQKKKRKNKAKKELAETCEIRAESSLSKNYLKNQLETRLVFSNLSQLSGLRLQAKKRKQDKLDQATPNFDQLVKLCN